MEKMQKAAEEKLRAQKIDLKDPKKNMKLAGKPKRKTRREAAQNEQAALGS